MKLEKVSEDVITRARQISLLVMDCDGVLTDGRLYFSAEGEVLKVFHVRDGQGLVSWHNAGFHSAIISGRGSEEILAARAQELRIRFLHTGSADKAVDLTAVVAELGIDHSEVCYVGDDIGDLGVMSTVGLAVAVRDAVPSVKEAAHLVTSRKGGRGAVREVTDLLLWSRGLS